MRILHLTTFLQGGAGRNITDLALPQRRAGHDVRVAADAGGEPGYASYPEYLDELAAAGVPVLRLTSTFKRDAALNTRAALELREACASWRPDVAHAHATTPAVVARLSGVVTSVPVVSTMHGWGITKTPEQALSDIATLEQADAVVVPSRAAAATLEGAGLEREDVQVIPYGLAVEGRLNAPDPDDVRAIEQLAAGRRRVGCIGTIGERKNQRLLVDALSGGGLHDIVAVFIGDGEVDELRARAESCGVGDRVLILGHRPDASRYLAAIDALVLPSRNEGLPLAVLEALRAGTPVAAARIPEIAEALDDGPYGHLFEPKDPAALTAAVRAALATTEAGRERLRKRFSTLYTRDRMLASYASLYESLEAHIQVLVGQQPRAASGRRLRHDATKRRSDEEEVQARP
jgi:glycosyltransferase involved in cell wall biosynthesis